MLYFPSYFADTEYANHGTEVAESLDLENFDGIVCVGGDGMVHEVIQGIMRRTDWKTVASNLPIAVIPGGSGNGIARSLCEIKGEYFNPLECCFLAIKGLCRPSPVDVASVLVYGSGSQIVRRIYTIQHIEWGCVADIDIESEKCRCVGDLRFSAQGVVRAWGLRIYDGKLMYLPVDVENQAGSHHLTGEAKEQIESLDHPQTSFIPTAEKGTEGWVEIDGRFATVWILQTKFQSVDVCNAPSSELDDGVFYVLIVRDTNECSMTKMLLDMDEKGSVSVDSRFFKKTKRKTNEAARCGAGYMEQQCGGGSCESLSFGAGNTAGWLLPTALLLLL